MPPSNNFTIDLAISLLVAADSAARSRSIALAVIQLLPDSGCIIHRVSSFEGEPAFQPVGIAGELSLAANILPADLRLLAPLSSAPPTAVVYSSGEFAREDYAHLNVSRSVSSLAYLPLLVQDQLVGALEILVFTPAPSVLPILLRSPQLPNSQGRRYWLPKNSSASAKTCSTPYTA